ncbi:MAG: hypothetical protein ACI39G_05825 [Pseudoramibacter sp.]
MKTIGEYKELCGKGLPIKEMISESPIPYKAEILNFMKHTPSPYVVLKYAIDPITGNFIDHNPDIYETVDKRYSWRYETMYCFEKYNLALPKDFIDYVLNQIKVSDNE